MANLSHDPAHQSFDATDPHSVEHGHGGSIRTYVMVALALVFLTACSYWTYTPFWPFGDNVAIKRTWMMAVSCTKAMLVILFFMHLKWEADWKYVLTIPASVMSIFLMLALVPDIGMRVKGNYGYHYSEWRMNRIGMPTDATEMEHVSEKLHPVDGTAKH